MPRDDSPYIVGDFWLDKRRDGKSPDIWQIARYAAASRSVVYRSTKQSSLEDAKPEIHNFAERERAKSVQAEEEARVIPLLILYWEEHGRDVVSPDQIASSIRQFIGFLNQDEAGLGVTVADLTPNLFTRFRQWRMKPHEYDVPWAGKQYAHKSKGVNGESVQRNVDDIRAGILHHVNNRRLRSAPKIPNVPDKFRSRARDRVLSMDELGAMFGYARSFPELNQDLCLMLSTAARPEAVWLFDPKAQYKNGMIDLHPPAWLRTKKRNPIIPAIEPMKPILKGWQTSTVKSRKTRLRTMRRMLELPADVLPKTIRHTVATMLRADGNVPRDMIEDLLGHRVNSKTTEVYAKYDPAYMVALLPALTTIFDNVMAAADSWLADHLLTTPKRGRKMTIDKRPI